MTALPANLAATAEPSCDALCCPTARPMPWLRLAIGLFVAAQTMSIGIAVNLTPPDDLTTRRLIDGVMLGATLAVMLLLGGPLVADVWDAIRAKKISMELLFLAGIGGALGISIQSMRLGSGPVYFDVVSVLLTVFSVGRAISRHSRERAVLAVASMRNVAPTARVIGNINTAKRTGIAPAAQLSTSATVHERSPQEAAAAAAFRAGEFERVIAASLVRADELVRVYPGELIPIDGLIETGEAFVRQSHFTGEIQSRVLRPGDAVTAGAGVEDGTLLIRATTSGDQRKLDRLVDLVERAAANPPALQRQADRFVRWFLPSVLAIAVATFAFWAHHVSFEKGLYAGLAVLLVACPCAAGLATPLTLWITLSRLARLGLIASSGDAIERFATAKSVVFDKTGTLADETLSLRVLYWIAPHCGEGKARMLAMIATVERGSGHPIAKLLACLSTDDTSFALLRLLTLPARGVEGLLLDRVTGTTHTVRLERDATAPAGVSRVGVWLDDRAVATVDVAESLRNSAAQCIDDLAARGLATHIMTGDASAGVADTLAPSSTQMTPHDKWQALQQLPRPLFIGDGVNDAPALAAAHASIAMASGSTLAVATATATLHGGDLSAIPLAIDLSRHAARLIRSNLRWAVAYNLLGIALAAGGWLHPVIAAVLMGVSSAVVSFRAFREAPVRGTGHEKAQPNTASTKFPDQSDESATSVVASKSAIERSARSSSSGLPASVGVILATSWIVQGFLLILIADLSILPAIGLLLVFTVIAWFVSSRYKTFPAWFDMTLAMVAVGGVGMNLGWWADLGFTSAIHAGAACCSTASGILAAPWMYVGMIALGTPAMYLLRRSPVRFSLRQWCCVGPLLLGLPAMVAGMWMGSVVAHTLSAGWSWRAATLLDALLMLAGMAIGMILPHALVEHASTDLDMSKP